MYAEVIVDIAHSNVDKLFTYKVPDELEIKRGHRVLVPFGARNGAIEGFVINILAATSVTGVRIKSIIKTLEPYTVLSNEQIELAKWISASYHCCLIDALRLMIPAQLRGGRVKEKEKRVFALANDVDIETVKTSLFNKAGESRAPKQSEVLDVFTKEHHALSMSDICAYVTGATQAVHALVKKGILSENGETVYRDPFKDIKCEKSEPLKLNDGQCAAYSKIKQAVDSREGILLLHGVTGSGKTEVYMHAISDVIKDGGTAIVLVPEISLTPQAMVRFKSRFGERIAVLHSRLSVGERYDEWRRIRLGKVDVVVGARSAVFAPLEKIRLIVIDEEHEPSYQSDSMPRYSAVETAIRRCKLCGAALVLGSATPSIVSYQRANAGRYQLLKMTQRANENPMPKVMIADMRAEFQAGNTSIFSRALAKRLEKCIDAGEQAILFMNRRGYSTFVSCRGCGYVMKCPDCDVSMTYHKLEGIMKCHYCDRVMKIPQVCPECGKPYLKYFGVGTQQVEEQLHELFPNVKALRMDMDTTRAKNSHYEILSRFANGDAQVLIGTQMVAKGLDIKNVTLVGVVAADSTLYIPDYRSCERTFALLTQVAGRAGRADKEGYVVVQTYAPEHPAITLAAKHDYEAFYKYEIASRRSALFPPYSIFARILMVGKNEENVDRATQEFADGIKKAVTDALTAKGANPMELQFVFASPAPIKRKQTLYRYQVLMKLIRTKNTGAAIKAIYEFFDANRSEYAVPPEINPTDLF